MKINEIFYSLQGEGVNAGIPAIFIRFSGCNLQCDFCDTEHNTFEELSEEDIVKIVKQYKGELVVITGGEPTIQLTRTLVEKLHKARKKVQIETNGTFELKDGLENEIDWITCSPKNKNIKIQRIDELKVVYEEQDMSQYDSLQAKVFSLQPCDRQDAEKNSLNIQKTIEYIKENPKWRLSLQTHKILHVR